MITEYYTTIGMDVSDRKIQVCIMTKSGVNLRIVKETTIPTTKEVFWGQSPQDEIENDDNRGGFV